MLSANKGIKSEMANVPNATAVIPIKGFVLSTITIGNCIAWPKRMANPDSNNILGFFMEKKATVAKNNTLMYNKVLADKNCILIILLEVIVN